MKKIEYKGIRTNNLKNIDISIPINSLTCLIGGSGSGKSSLAFNTICAISSSEYDKLVNDNYVDQEYNLDFYDNILFSIPLKQLNFNINPRSSIMTYFGLHNYIKYLLCKLTGISFESFNYNGKKRCKKCNGLGYENKIDLSKLIDNNIKIKDMPFRCWQNSYSDYYKKLLINYCEDENINLELCINQLNENEINKLLYGVSEKKYKIKYKLNKVSRVKTSKYIGAVEYYNNEKVKNKKYSSQYICTECNGSRLSKQIIEKFIFEDCTVKDFLIRDFYNISKYLKVIKYLLNNDERAKIAIENIENFVNGAIDLGLGNLNFNRTISTCSGGEFQRLRMVNIISSKLSNLLLVLDEPTESLHPVEVNKMIQILFGLKKNNTLLIVEHNKKVIDLADKIYCLGPGGGAKGGSIINYDKYKKSLEYKLEYCFFEPTNKQNIKLVSDFLNYKGTFNFRENTLTALCGTSGVGKTTILKNILKKELKGYKYISQKPIKGNNFSTVATYTGIFDEIRKIYSSEFDIDKSMFTRNGKGACKYCSGSGKVIIGDLYNSSIYETCENCLGTGYSKKALQYKWNGFNIYDLMELEIDTIINMNFTFTKKIVETLKLLSDLGLGHLRLSQQISTLSGGENQRIKLSLAMKNSSYKIFGLDEPSKGLNERDIKKLVSVIYKNIEGKNKTYIISDHNPTFLKYCSYLVELKKIEGYTEVIFDDKLELIHNCKFSLIKEYI